MAYERETGKSGTAAYLVKQARVHHCLIRKLSWEGRNFAPDYLLIFPDGELHFIEMKSPTGETTVGQDKEHTRLRRYGQRVHVLKTKSAVDVFFTENKRAE